MSETGGYSPLPGPEEVFRGIERELGIPINQEPDWNYAPTKEQLFVGEAPTYTQRELAANVLHNFYFFQSRPPGEEPASVEDLLETFNHVREAYQEDWNDPDPFPDITLEHVLGATRRQIAWLEEQRAFEECNSYDRSIQEYYSIHSLVEQALNQSTREAEERVEHAQTAHNEPNTPQHISEQARDKRRVETLVAGIESDIRAGPPHLGERFPNLLPSPTYKLLPGEADSELARALSFICSDALLRLVSHKTRNVRHSLTTFDTAVTHDVLDTPHEQDTAQRALSEQDLVAYFQEYLQNEPVSYTLDNVLAATKRRLLSRHLGRDRRLNVVDREVYQDTVRLHDLLAKAAEKADAHNTSGGARSTTD